MVFINFWNYPIMLKEEPTPKKVQVFNMTQLFLSNLYLQNLYLDSAGK